MKNDAEKQKRGKAKELEQATSLPAWKRNINKAVSNIVAHRNAMGITQQALADKIGVEQSVIGRFERMGRIPTLESLYKIAEGLNMQISPLRISDNIIQKTEDDDLQLPEPQRPRWKKDLAELVSDLTVYRVKKKITQAELAKRIGSTQASIARFEYLDRIPSIEYLYRVAEGLDLKLVPIEIYYLDEEKINKIKLDVSWQFLQDDEIIVDEPVDAFEVLAIMQHLYKIHELSAEAEDNSTQKPTELNHGKKIDKTDETIDENTENLTQINLLVHRRHGIA